jgi:predicted ATP-grasp superfamily ATP-dependent carboligase
VNVLVTDTHYKNGLCAVRSLGRRGATVVAAAPRRLAPGAYSRFTSARVFYPPAQEDEILRVVNRAIERHSIDVILPMSQELVEVFARNRGKLLGDVRVPIADTEKIRIAADKEAALSFARSVGVPTPHVFAGPTAVDRFPVVVKPALGSGVVRYVNDADELAKAFDPTSTIQEYIPGNGYGFFALFDRGNEKAVFMHRRIREYPVTGGASTAAESFYDPQLLQHGLKLLRALGWHGVAMAEFKLDERDGEYKLIEINPKFWGSLDLSVAAGVDFPWLATRVALGEQFAPVVDYQVGLRFRWIFDDLLHLLARPSSTGSIARDIANRSVRSDLDRSDLAPTAVDGVRFGGAVVRRIRTGTLRRPHGAAARAFDRERTVSETRNTVGSNGKG